MANRPVRGRGAGRLTSGSPRAPSPERRETRHRGPRRKRPRSHRAYGLPNANQIFLTIVLVVLLFIQLLRPHWLVFKKSDATAGLSSIRLMSSINDTSTRVSWHAFCDPDDYNFTLPIDPTVHPPLAQPFDSRTEAQHACATNTPEKVRVLSATQIAFSMLSVVVALYFHLGAPSQRQVVVLGLVPGVALLATGVLGTAGLAIWQKNFGPYDNGDCFSVAVAATVIAYVVAISMAIRWRWPGIFAVDEEQQAFEVRRNWRRRPQPTAAPSDNSTTPTLADSPLTNQNTFHQVV